jgi:hypothetical protein
MEKHEIRAIKKLNQIYEEIKKDPKDWHSIAHLSRDLCAVATAVNSNPKYENKRTVHSA